MPSKEPVFTLVTNSPVALPSANGDRHFFTLNPASQRISETRPGTYELRNASGEQIGIAQPAGEYRPAMQRMSAIRMAHSKELATMCSLISRAWPALKPPSPSVSSTSP